MLKNQKNSLFSLDLINVFTAVFMVCFLVAGPMFAIDARDDLAGCADAPIVSLVTGQGLEIEPGPEGVQVWAEDSGYLLAEAYSILPTLIAPQVVIEGVGRAGADWLAGRLLPIAAGSYCVKVASQSPKLSLGETRLVLALADNLRKTELPPVGDEIPDEVIDDVLLTGPGSWPYGGAKTELPPVGDEIPDEVIDDVLLTAPGSWPYGGAKTELPPVGDEIPDEVIDDVLFAAPGEVPFRKASAAGGAGYGKTTDPVGDEIPDEVIDDVLLTTPDPSPQGGTLRVSSGWAKTELPPVGDEIPDEVIDDVLLQGGSPKASRRSVASELGLCGSDSTLSGAFACAAELPLGRAIVSSLSQKRAEVETFTFEVHDRATLAFMIEGAAEWVALYDESGRPVDHRFSDDSGELIRTVSAGRYMVRVGSNEAGGWYSLGVGELER